MLVTYQAFQTFDAEKTQTITQSEFRRALESFCIPVTDDQFEQLLRKVKVHWELLTELPELILTACVSNPMYISHVLQGIFMLASCLQCLLNTCHCLIYIGNIPLLSTKYHKIICKCINALYHINTNEIPGELSRENLISSHVKITCYLHMWKYHRCYGFIINRAFHTKKLLKWNGFVFHWCLYNK